MVWKPRVTVAAVIHQNDHFLLVREQVDERVVYNQPAGHLEANESLVDAVIREVREETTRCFAPRGLVGIYRYPLPGGDQTYLRFCFAGTVEEPRRDLHLDPDILDNQWLTLQKIVVNPGKMRSPMVQQCIEDYLCRPLLPLSMLHDLP